MTVKMFAERKAVSCITEIRLRRNKIEYKEQKAKKGSGFGFLVLKNNYTFKIN